MNDLQVRLSTLNPVPIEGVDEAAGSPEALALLARVLDEPIARPALSPSDPERVRGPGRGRGRSRRLPVLAAVGAIVIAGATIGWALTNSARDASSVQCEIRGVDTIIPAITGSPVDDCAAQWLRDTGYHAPPLVAYDNGHGGITVLPADGTPLPGWTPLPAGATQNVPMIQVQRSLEDYVDGLHSGCFDNATAIRMTKHTLALYGLADWTVRPAPQTELSDPSTPCVKTAVLDPSTDTVQLRALDGRAPSDAPFEQLAAKLRPIAQECLPLGAAAKEVLSAAGDLGLSEAAHEFELTQIRDNGARCTTIDEGVGGTIFLVLSGPAG
jgi:hypothetical protein